MIKDWNSMIVLLDTPPKTCPPVNPDSLILYCRECTVAVLRITFIGSKRNKKGVPLTQNGQVLKTDDGEEILSWGGWKSPNNEVQFKSAISTLHKVRGQGGEFTEGCKECLIEYQNTRVNQGCAQHRYYIYS
jgi:hypothetical protein